MTVFILISIAVLSALIVWATHRTELSQVTGLDNMGDEVPPTPIQEAPAKLWKWEQKFNDAIDGWENRHPIITGTIGTAFCLGVLAYTVAEFAGMPDGDALTAALFVAGAVTLLVSVVSFCYYLPNLAKALAVLFLALLIATGAIHVTAMGVVIGLLVYIAFKLNEIGNSKASTP